MIGKDLIECIPIIIPYVSPATPGQLNPNSPLRDYNYEP